jgi:uncharacterized damage-inducible protein DinB
MASARIPGFKGEYLWELDIVEHQLSAIAEAIPAERYSWRPTPTARSVSEVFVHIATGNLGLLDVAGVPAPREMYGTLDAQGASRFFGIILKNQEIGGAITTKADVIRLLHSALAVGRESFTATTNEQLEAVGTLFGEETTVRRVYLRVLTHMHEHMGQLIGYVRMMGLNVPWPDPLDFVKAQLAPAPVVTPAGS